MKIVFELILLAILVVVFVFFFGLKIKAPSPQEYSLGTVCAKEKCFTVELAKTRNQIERGLMFREKMDKGNGMLFIFDKEGSYSFWMKNTLIPLDIIWINENKEVVFINGNTQPCKDLVCPQVNPKTKAKYVLELNAGIASEISLKVGDKIELSGI